MRLFEVRKNNSDEFVYIKADYVSSAKEGYCECMGKKSISGLSTKIPTCSIEYCYNKADELYTGDYELVDSGCPNYCYPICFACLYREKEMSLLGRIRDLEQRVFELECSNES
jgi:hypothetical protein